MVREPLFTGEDCEFAITAHFSRPIYQEIADAATAKGLTVSQFIEQAAYAAGHAHAEQREQEQKQSVRASINDWPFVHRRGK